MRANYALGGKPQTRAPVLVVWGGMSDLGQTQKTERPPGQSALPSRTDVASWACQVRNVPIGGTDDERGPPTEADLDRRLLADRW